MTKIYNTLNEIIQAHILNEQWLQANKYNIAVAKNLKFFPAYYNDGQWHYHTEAFLFFYKHCTSKENYHSELVSLSDIRYNGIDPACPFSIQQLGVLYSLNMLRGVEKKRGTNKKVRYIFIESYFEAKKFWETQNFIYKDDLITLEDHKPKYPSYTRMPGMRRKNNIAV